MNGDVFLKRKHVLVALRTDIVTSNLDALESAIEQAEHAGVTSGSGTAGVLVKDTLKLRNYLVEKAEAKRALSKSITI